MAALPPVGATMGNKPSELIEAPKIDVPLNPVTQAPAPSLGSPAVPPPAETPKVPAPSKPEIRFEKPGTITGTPSGQSRIPVPNASVSEAIRMASQGRGGGGNQVVEDFSQPSPLGGFRRPTRSRGSVELLSDPNGIDFKPYLIQVLAAVKRNWFAVMPESARFGRRGQVRIQFAINRDGGVPKLVIANSSGFEAFDRAAVAGVSASNPFPPLPREFQGGSSAAIHVFVQRRELGALHGSREYRIFLPVVQPMRSSGAASPGAPRCTPALWREADRAVRPFSPRTHVSLVEPRLIQ